MRIIYFILVIIGVLLFIFNDFYPYLHDDCGCLEANQDYKIYLIYIISTIIFVIGIIGLIFHKKNNT